MSDFTELMISRRSVRKYKAAQIPEESLQAIVKTGSMHQTVEIHKCGISQFFKIRIH